MSYANMDHAEWVEGNNRAGNKIYANRRSHRPAPETLSPFQTKVMDILGMVCGGIYNAPINWEKVNWEYGGRGVAIPLSDRRMATFDFDGLTKLVFLCHEARIRCDISARTNGLFLLTFWQRSHDGAMQDRHPNIDEAVSQFRAYLPSDHRIIYQMPAVDEQAAA